VIETDGLARCWWGSGTPEYIAYHDGEWGRPVADDNRLFEKLCLEGFQAGLSWLTILRKRANFRAVFANFDPVALAAFGEEDVARLKADAGIVRHEGKIRSVINNAQRTVELIELEGSLAEWVWSYAGERLPAPDSIPATTPVSIQLARDLKSRGFSFVGPTTVYAFMQAMGLVNDHLASCFAREACELEYLARFGGKKPGAGAAWSPSM
jgi:DNA-3-methyladenine glycosylase I